MTRFLFMSPEHVEALNARLAASEPVRAACARLEQDILILQRLTDEDGGPDVFWQVRFEREAGSSLRLGPPEREPDLTWTGGYWAMIAYMAARDLAQPAPLTASGDVTAMERAKEAWAASQAVAIKEIDFPVRGG